MSAGWGAFHRFGNMPSPCEDVQGGWRCGNYERCSSELLSCLSFVVFTEMGVVRRPFSHNWPSVEMHALANSSAVDEAQMLSKRAIALDAEQQAEREPAAQTEQQSEPECSA